MSRGNKVILVCIVIVLLIGVISGSRINMQEHIETLNHEVDDLLDKQDMIVAHNEALLERIKTLEVFNAGLLEKTKVDYEFLATGLLYMNLSNSDKRRFLLGDISMHMLPYGETHIIREVACNTVIDVTDLVKNKEGELWYCVSVPVYDTPMDSRGWIRADEVSTPYTEAYTKQVLGPVWIEDGTPVIETYSFPNWDEGISLEPCYGTIWGQIEGRKDNYVRIAGAGGITVIVKDTYIQYPEVLD